MHIVKTIFWLSNLPVLMFFLLVDLIQQLLALFFPYVILLLIYPFRYQKKKSQIDLKSTAPTKKQ